MGAKLSLISGSIRIWVTKEALTEFLSTGSISLDIYTEKDLQAVGQGWLNVTDTARSILEIHETAFRAAMEEAKAKFYIEHPDYVNRKIRKSRGKK